MHLRRVVLALVLAVGSASCSALFDFDLSGSEAGEGGVAPSGDAALDGRGSPDQPRDGGSGGEDGAAEEAGGDAAAPADAGADVVYTLPCTPGAADTPLCDGFEGRTDPSGTIWYTTDEQGASSTLSLPTPGGSGSARHARFSSAAGAAGTFLLGRDGTLAGNSTLWVSADVRLAYTAASYAGAVRRNLIGVYGLSGGSGGNPQGFVGVSLVGASGVTAEAKEINAGARTTRSLDDALNGTGWHRVELEIVLATTTAGRLRVWIDNRAQQSITGQATVSAAVDAFSIWIGANAEGGQPSIVADYDNVSVRFGARP